VNRPDRGSLRAELPAVTLLFAVLTLLFAYPLSVRPGSSVLPQGADTDLMLWIFGWDVHALTRQPWAIFDGNIYHPYRHTLAYAENLIGSAMLSAPIIWITGNLVLAMNGAALLSCVLCGVGAYVLARRLGLGPAGAVITGLIFAFAPPRFFRLGQLHLTTVQWLPFCLASLQAYLDDADKRDLRWACAFFTFQVYTSGHGAVLTAVAILMLVIWRVLLGEAILPVKRARDLGGIGLALLALTGLCFLPYRAVQQEMGLRRSLSESYLFAPNVESFLASPSYVDQFVTSKLTDRPVLARAKALLFPGYLTLMLAAAGVWSLKPWRPSHRIRPMPANGWTRVSWVVDALALAVLVLAIVVTVSDGVKFRFGSQVLFSAREPLRQWLQFTALAGIRLALVRRAPLDIVGRWRRFAQRLFRWSDWLRRDPITLYVPIAIFATWLALGPGFGLYNRVYGWPGFSFIRVPSRFMILTLLALAVLAGAAFDRWTTGVAPRRRTLLAAMAGLLLVGEFASFPLATIPYAADIPPIDRWLDTQPKPFVVAEVPAQERLQAAYMIHATAHWQKTIHGYSGMRPALHSALYEELLTFPDERSLASLTSLSVSHVIVHTNAYMPGEWPRVEQRIGRFAAWLTLEHVEGDGRVYRLRRPLVMTSGDPRGTGYAR